MSTTMHYALAEGQAAAIQGIYAEYVAALGDADKAADGFDAGYYQGRADAFVGALSVLGAFRENTCAVCHQSLLFTADGKWVSEVDWDDCQPVARRPVIQHTPTFEAEEEPSSADETEIRVRLEYLRSQIQAECISYGEIAELQGLADHIEDGDVELLEWAGVPEGGWIDCPQCTYRAIDNDDLAEHTRLNPLTHGGNRHQWSATFDVTTTDIGVLMDAFVELANAVRDASAESSFVLLDSTGGEVLSL